MVARTDPNPVVSGNGVQALRAAGVHVEVGCCREPAERLIEAFACHVTTGLPLVVGKAGMSLDGRIAVSRDARTRISSDETREFGQQLRLQVDALAVGIGTILADDPQLTYRGRLRKARPLTPVVLDSWLRTPLTARFFDSEPGREILIFRRHEAAPEPRRMLQDRGATIISVGHGPAGLDLKSILAELGARKKLGVLVEGGSEVHGSFLAAGLVDKFYFMIAPVVLGGRNSVPVVGGPGFATVCDAPRFRVTRTFHCGPDLIQETYPSYSRSILTPWRS